ncbi:MAG: HAD-IIA family hydrolase, partial [Aeromicrobium sp.]
MSLASTKRTLCDTYDLAMLDLDGVVYVGADAVPEAAKSLALAKDAGMSLAYVTNNASRTPHDIADHLRELGMPDVSDGDVVTSAQAVAHLIANAVPPGAEILVVGGAGLYDALEERGLRGVERLGDDTAAVVQGFHPEVNWRMLAEGTYAVNAGLPWFASNLDLSVPTARGIAPGNGALVGLIAQATGRRPIAAGKPEVALFNETTERVGGQKPLVVGDRLDTDIEGASNVGADSFAVLTGVSDIQAIADAEGKQRPNFVAPDLRGLLKSHSPVSVSGDESRCGSGAVRLVDGAIVATAIGDETDLLRA